MVRRKSRPSCRNDFNSTGLRYGTRGFQSLEGNADGILQEIHLQNGKTLKREAMFFTTGCRQSSDLSAALGCARDEKGSIVTDPAHRGK